MKVGGSSTNFAEVKKAFESVYEEVGITCADVGGIWNDPEDKYFEGAEPCVDTAATQSAEVRTETNSTLAIVLGSVFGALFAIAATVVVYMRSREKKGQPVFQAAKNNDGATKDMN